MSSWSLRGKVCRRSLFARVTGSLSVFRMLFGRSDTLELLHCILDRREGNTGRWAAGFGSQVGSLRCGVEFPRYGPLSRADGEDAPGDAHALFIHSKWRLG